MEQTTRLRGVILDTNVWSYFQKVYPLTAASKLKDASEAAGIPIIIAPSVLYELLKNSNRPLMEAHVRLVTEPCWSRLMPEAYWECDEILNEVRRVRPEWLKEAPDLSWRDANFDDWSRLKKGFWQRTRNDPQQIAKFTAHPNESDALVQAKAKQKSVVGKSPKEWKDMPWAEMPSDTAGWRGERVKLWRVEACDVVRTHLKAERNPYHDWLLPFLKSPIDAESWNSFWFYDADEQAMPRHVLRSLVEWKQAFNGMTKGTPCDSQLAAYLIDGEYICSADSVFAKIIEECAALLPFPIARPIKIEKDDRGAEQLLHWFSIHANAGTV